MQLVRVDRSGPRLEETRSLFLEYWSSFGFTPCFQGFDGELAGLPGAYGPPRGALLLARGEGCVGVRPQARGTGLGRALAAAAVAHARETGFSRLVLDTLPDKMAEAVALYRAMGFIETGPYLPQPTPGALCLELSLR